MKIGGQIPWNAIPILETFKISCLLGRLHTKGVLENNLKDRLCHLVHWLSITPSLRRTSQESNNLESLTWIVLLGYALYAEGIWKGDVLVADLEELETMDASEIYSKRLNAKEVIFPKQGEFIFPIADGRIKTPGGDQELRTSTLVRHRPIQGESHIDFLGESEGSFTVAPAEWHFPNHDGLVNAQNLQDSMFTFTLHANQTIRTQMEYVLSQKERSADLVDTEHLRSV